MRELQRMLNALGFDSGKEDGFYGPRTDGALRVFQRNVGDEPDGSSAPTRCRCSDGCDRSTPSPLVRSCASARNSTPPVDRSRGRIIAIDVAESGADEMAQERSAAALVDELRAVGADPRVLGTDDDAAAPSDRARLANEVGAAASITVELTARDEEGGGGPVCSYFGSRTTHSPSGLVLAQLILEELEAELGVSGRVRPLTIAPLRETRMPAVQVEPITGIGRARTSSVAIRISRYASPAPSRRVWVASSQGRRGRRASVARTRPMIRPRMVALVARSCSDGYRSDSSTGLG